MMLSKKTKLGVIFLAFIALAAAACSETIVTIIDAGVTPPAGPDFSFTLSPSEVDLTVLKEGDTLTTVTIDTAVADFTVTGWFKEIAGPNLTTLFANQTTKVHTITLTSALKEALEAKVKQNNSENIDFVVYFSAEGKNVSKTQTFKVKGIITPPPVTPPVTPPPVTPPATTPSGIYWSSLVVSKDDGSFDTSKKHEFTEKNSIYRLKGGEMKPFLLEISNYNPKKELIIGVGKDMHCQKVLDYMNVSVQQKRTETPTAGYSIGATIREVGGGIGTFVDSFWAGLTAAAKTKVTKNDLTAIKIKLQTFGLVLQVNDQLNLEKDKIYPFPLAGLDNTMVKPKIYLEVKSVNGTAVKDLSDELEIVACQFTKLPARISEDESEVFMQFGEVPPGVNLNYKDSVTTSSPGKDTTVNVNAKQNFSIVATGLLKEDKTSLFLFKNKTCEGVAAATVNYDGFKSTQKYDWANLNWQGVTGAEQSICACQAQAVNQCLEADSAHKASITVKQLSKAPETNLILEVLAQIDKKLVDGIFK